MCEDMAAVQQLERSLGSRLLWARKFKVRACVSKWRAYLLQDSTDDFRSDVQFPPNFTRSFAQLTLSIACLNIVLSAFIH